MSSVDMAPRSFAQEVHANFMESLMVMSRALSRPTMGAKELCSWSTLSTRLAKLLREEAIAMTRTGKLLLCIAFIGFSSIDGGRNAVMSVPKLQPMLYRCASLPRTQGAPRERENLLMFSQNTLREKGSKIQRTRHLRKPVNGNIITSDSTGELG